MAITCKSVKDQSILVFDGEVTIYTVAQLKEELFVEQKNLSSQVALDLQAVTEIDTAGVQLLLFLKKAMASASKKVAIIKTNELVDSVFATLDVNFHFAQEH